MAKTAVPLQKKFLVPDIPGYCKLRISHRKQRGKKDPSYVIKCGCCAQKVAIYYDTDDESLEINGVLASVKEWRKVLSPLFQLSK